MAFIIASVIKCLATRMFLYFNVICFALKIDSAKYDSAGEIASIFVDDENPTNSLH